MSRLAERLEIAWAEQVENGFLLGDPEGSPPEIRRILDRRSGVRFRLRWLPHRELRTDVAELESRGILSRDRDESRLHRDPRDVSGRYCFLCPANIRQANPLEVLIPMSLAGRSYFAGANFAWITRHHFSVMSQEHRDQTFSRHVLEAMLDLHRQTGGKFRVVYNGASTGATIPWHLHYQITPETFPVEELGRNAEERYPMAVQRFDGESVVDRVTAAVAEWEWLDPQNHQANLLVAGPVSDPLVHVFQRDKRLQRAAEKGLIGGFEVCGDLVYSEPRTRGAFERANAQSVRATLEAIRPNASKT